MPTRRGLPLIDFSCLKPMCLVNGGRCTGVRHVPDPSIPVSAAEARQRGGETFVPMPVLREITRHVREEVAKKLARRNDPGVTPQAIRRDIDFVREAHRREMRKSGVYV